MPLQPYFPEPVSVHGNVASAKHRVRTTFVRKVAGAHVLTLSLAGVVARFLPLTENLGTSVSLFFVCLVLLTLVRRVSNETKFVPILDGLLLVPTVLTFGFTLKALYVLGWPVHVLAPVTVGIGLYVLLCGNDLSYTGQFVLCSGFTIVSTVAFCALGWMTSDLAIAGLLVAESYLFFYVYDLTMLIKRRRSDEYVSAVADLYRDLLNFATYSVRVYFHWRKFRFI